jgi:hypothetical protein
MEAFIQRRSVARCVLTSARNCAAIYRGSRSGSATIVACIPDHVAIASDAIISDLDPIFAERSATVSVSGAVSLFSTTRARRVIPASPEAIGMADLRDIWQHNCVADDFTLAA